MTLALALTSPWGGTLPDRLLFWIVASTLLALAGALLFASLAIAFRISNTRRATRWNRIENRWTEQILKALATPSLAGPFEGTVSPNESLFFIDFLLRWSRRVQGEEAEALSRIAQPFLPKVAELLNQGLPERRAWALFAVGTLGSDAHSPLLVQALDDPSSLAAIVAARGLARRGDPTFAPPLIEHSERFDPWSPRILADTVASIGPSVAPLVRPYLTQRDRSPRVRQVACEVLRQLHDVASADLAAQALSVETDLECRASLLRLIGTVGWSVHLPAVRALLRSPDLILRINALAVLGRIGEETDMEDLQRGLEDPSPWVAIQAATGLRDRGKVEVLQAWARKPHPRADLARQMLEDDLIS
jgi:HEAT repeat protein